MVTPEVNEEFCFDFSSFIENFHESMHTDHDKPCNPKPVTPRHGIAHSNTKIVYDHVRGQHALKRLPAIALRLLHNFALYNGISCVHEAIFRAYISTQNVRGATHVIFQPQVYLGNHIRTMHMSLALLTQCLESQCNLTGVEHEIIEQRIMVALKSSVDSAIVNYRKLFTMNDSTGFLPESRDNFEELLRLNSVLYRLEYFLKNDKIADKTRRIDASEDAMWDGLIHKLKTRAQDEYREARTCDRSESWWEIDVGKITSSWTRFGDADSRRLEEAYLDADLDADTKEVELDSCTVDLVHFFARSSTTGYQKIRGMVGGERAKSLKPCLWGEEYEIVVFDALLPFTLCAHPYTRHILVDHVNKDSPLSKRGGMEVGDRLVSIDGCLCVGLPLDTVYQELLGMKRPFHIRLMGGAKDGNALKFCVSLCKLDIHGEKLLGLKLAPPKSRDMSRVAGFTRIGSTVLPAERCCCIRKNDHLCEINGVDVSLPSVTHAEVVKMLSDSDTLQITFERFRSGVDYETQRSETALCLIQVAGYILTSVKNDEKYYGRVVKHFVKNSTTILNRSSDHADLSSVNLKYFYDLFVHDIIKWLDDNPAGGKANVFPEHFFGLYNALGSLEDEIAKWHGENWPTLVGTYFDSKHAFGKFVVGWIEQSYVKLSSETIPRYFEVETWDVNQPIEIYPWSSTELIYLTNNLLDMYTRLPNSEEISNVIRFGKEDICELFCFYCDQVKEDFKVASLRLKDKTNALSSAKPEEQKALEEKNVNECMRLCHRINGIYHCYDALLDVLKGLNQLKTVDGFLHNDSDSSDEEEIAEDTSHHTWGDHFDDEIAATSSLIVHIVRIRLLSAKQLPKLSYGGLVSSDPYVELRVYEDGVQEGCWFAEAKTKVIHSTQNPEWNESFEFTVVRKDAKLLLCVLDFDSYSQKSKEIGRIIVDCSQFFCENGQPNPGAVSEDLHSNGKCVGQLNFIVVSRVQEMGGGTVRRLNTIMETMINTNEWGLVAALREKIRHLVDDLIFSTHATKMVVDDQNVDLRLDSFYTFLDQHLPIWCSSLHEVCFAKVLARLWREIMDIFIQFLLPTLGRAYEYSHQVYQRINRKTSIFDKWSSKSKKNISPEARTKGVVYLNDTQVEVLRRAYRLLLDYLGADGSKSGLKEWLAIRELGGEFLMLCEMWDEVSNSSEIIIRKAGKILGGLNDTADKASKLGWDSKYGRDWKRLQMSKDHLYHLLLYTGAVIGNEQVNHFLSSHQKIFNDPSLEVGTSFKEMENC
jgi:hypothetical protein